MNELSRIAFSFRSIFLTNKKKTNLIYYLSYILSNKYDYQLSYVTIVVTISSIDSLPEAIK